MQKIVLAFPPLGGSRADFAKAELSPARDPRIAKRCMAGGWGDRAVFTQSSTLRADSSSLALRAFFPLPLPNSSIAARVSAFGTFPAAACRLTRALIRARTALSVATFLSSTANIPDWVGGVPPQPPSQFKYSPRPPLRPSGIKATSFGGGEASQPR